MAEAGENTRAGFVALIGEPNAGKSTLLNRMVGAKVSIVTHKVQTTRTRIRGIAMAGQSQIVFVDYRMSANASILVETWRWPEREIEALTIYHLDAGSLLATHFCPIGNQPRLALRSGKDAADDKLVFDFVAATNLPDPTADHNTEFWFRLDGPATFTRSETYLDKGKLDTQVRTYRRIESPPGAV